MPAGKPALKGARLAVAALLMATVVGCGASAGGSGDSYSIAVTGEPDTLLPGAADQEAERRVVNALFTGLVRYGTGTARPLLAVAESIRSADQRHWTIEIEKGWTFHNGELVTSENFVRAWNAVAYGPNNWAGNRWFSRFAGYRALNPPDPDGPGGPRKPPKPRTRTLSGLRVVDDYTFTVTLREPFSQFPMILGKPAFFPLPQLAFSDPEEFGERPIGNGPYQLDGSWERDGSVELTWYEDYSKDYEDYGGEYPAKAEYLTYKAYPDVGAAYQSLLDGDVDIVPSLPPRLYDDASDDLGGRFVFRPGATLVYLGVPLYGERFADPRLRRALSMAIDREKIVEEYLSGVPTPAESLVAPTVPGSRTDSCASWCDYDPERARKLFQAAGGHRDTLHLWYPSGSGHQQWMAAVGGMLERNLGLDAVRFHRLEPRRYAAAVAAQRLSGPWRGAWAPAFPSPHAYLRPLFTTGGRANHTGYSNDRVDRLVRKGARAESIDAAMDRYHHAADIVLGDMPVVPLWFQNANAAHSPRVGSVVVDAFGHIRVSRVVVS